MSESIINCGPWLVMDKKQSGYIYTDTHTSGRKPPPDFVFDLTFARVNQNQSFLVLAFAWLPPIDCTIFRIVALFGQATGGYLAAPISCPSCAHGLHAKCEIRNCEMMCDTDQAHTHPTHPPHQLEIPPDPAPAIFTLKILFAHMDLRT